ncbi:glycosyltransferase family 2 protein [Phormidium tenue]|uniref:Glycosyltransferase 2-like domain-containing protein n=1 Tax=Phormidium tenue NIES-30 TaxID=549789 RepID=A0A1U7J663_9CYAN|nr:glycosyltransferase family A protein [Phormidium tenue]MBD2231992.1 glycosyltransferase family 2 protein [Phormidium tenue FACHB-1052]OKH48412.1 hypothetical protein NIES30_10330 [Phormidium tenue NIES-30]
MVNLTASTPDISVVIPTYNRADILSRTIDSVLQQTHQNLELIIVDDGSTDGTAALVSAIDDARVRFMPLGENRGGGYARNQGIKAAAGKYIALLDSDDEWLPNKLELQIALLDSATDPKVAAAYCTYYERHELTKRDVFIGTTHAGDIFDRLLAGWCPPSSAVLTHREALLEVDGFDENLPSFQDFDLWLRLAQAGYRFVVVDQPMLIKHVHSGLQVSTNPAAKLKGFEIFEQRWGQTIQQRLSVQTYERWAAQHLAYVQLSQFRVALAKGKILAAWKFFIGMTQYLPHSRKLMVKGFLFAILGSKRYAKLAESNAVKGS